jgi:hypothetical protein
MNDLYIYLFGEVEAYSMKPSLTYLKILPSEELTYKILHRLNQMQVTHVLSLLMLVEAFSVIQLLMKNTKGRSQEF